MPICTLKEILLYKLEKHSENMNFDFTNTESIKMIPSILGELSSNLSFRSLGTRLNLEN